MIGILPPSAAGAGLIPGWGALPCSQKATTEQKQCRKKFNKDLKKVVHIKKKIFFT